MSSLSLLYPLFVILRVLLHLGAAASERGLAQERREQADLLSGSHLLLVTLKAFPTVLSLAGLCRLRQRLLLKLALL